MTAKQYGFALLESKNIRHFGGAYLKNSNPKKARPISLKRSMHLVMLLARLILGAERGRARNIQFWDQRPFTRIVEWGRENRVVCTYLLRNTLEALGFIEYTPRKRPKIKFSG